MRILHNATIPAIVGLCLLMVGIAPLPSSADQNDSFQQVTNYIVTGNPLERKSWVLTARIFDRENCVSGFEDDLGGTFKIFWNNVDLKSIELGYEQFGTASSQALSFTGTPHVVDSQVANTVLGLTLLSAGIVGGKQSSVSIPVQGIDENRLRKAFEILYSEHCTGSDVRSAF